MKKIKKIFNKEDGFTLIETTIVLLVIALLTILILPNVSGVTKNVNDSTSTAVIETVETQKMLYESNNPKKAPIDLEDLVKSGYITQAQLDAYINAESSENVPE